jgi:hypothetical protein
MPTCPPVVLDENRTEWVPKAVLGQVSLALLGMQRMADGEAGRRVWGMGTAAFERRGARWLKHAIEARSTMTLTFGTPRSALFDREALRASFTCWVPMAKRRRSSASTRTPSRTASRHGPR